MNTWNLTRAPKQKFTEAANDLRHGNVLDAIKKSVSPTTPAPDVSADDFRLAIINMAKSLEQSCGGTPINATIKAYNKIKSTNGARVASDTLKHTAEENEKKVFASINANDTDALNGLEAIFDKAVYIEAILAPVDENCAPQSLLGRIETKGTDHRKISCYAQGETKKGLAEQNSKDAFPSWKHNNSTTNNHDVTHG